MMIGDKHGWLELKRKLCHNNTEEDIDGDWVDEDNIAVGEGEGGLGRQRQSCRGLGQM
jgi:hypothetical protein